MDKKEVAPEESTFRFRAVVAFAVVAVAGFSLFTGSFRNRLENGMATARLWRRLVFRTSSLHVDDLCIHFSYNSASGHLIRAVREPIVTDRRRGRLNDSRNSENHASYHVRAGENRFAVRSTSLTCYFDPCRSSTERLEKRRHSLGN